MLIFAPIVGSPNITAIIGPAAKDEKRLPI